MRNGVIQNNEVIKLCYICPKNPMLTGDSSTCTEISQGFCKLVQNADNTLYQLKTTIALLRKKNNPQFRFEQFARYVGLSLDEIYREERLQKSDSEQVEKIFNQKEQDYQDNLG